MGQAVQYPSARPWSIARHATIVSTGMFVPERVVTNDDIIHRYNLLATDRAVQFATGIRERRWDDRDRSAADFLAEATRQCLDRAGVRLEQVDRVIYSRLVGDHFVPATSVGMLRKMGSGKGIPAFDLCAACSGFLHALDMAIRYIDSGDDYVLILVGAAASKSPTTSNKKDTRTIFLMGDGVVAVLLGPSSKEHFICSYVYSDPTHYKVAYIPFGSHLLNVSRKFNDEIFNMQIPNGKAIYDTAVAAASRTLGPLLEMSGLRLDDIDLFVTSDQTTQVWEGQLRALRIPREKSVSCFSKYGNTVAAMTALNLEELITSGRLQRGMLVLMMAHGAGSSGGGLVFRY